MLIYLVHLFPSFTSLSEFFLLPILCIFSQHNHFIQIPPKTHCYPQCNDHKSCPNIYIFYFHSTSKSGIKKMENQKHNTKIQNPTTHKNTELIQKVLIPSSSFPRAPYFICVGFYDSLHITQKSLLILNISLQLNNI